jgi:hypothetical protein
MEVPEPWHRPHQYKGLTGQPSRDPSALQDARHALMRDAEASPRSHLFSNSPQRPPLSPQSGDISDRLLLRPNRRQLTIAAPLEAKGTSPPRYSPRAFWYYVVLR